MQKGKSEQVKIDLQERGAAQSFPFCGGPASPGGHKLCSKCGETKSISRFTKNRSTPTGLCCWCKDCKHVAARVYRRTENGKRTTARHRKTESSRARERRRSEHRTKKYPERKRAVRFLNQHVANGRIKRPHACSCCGQERKVGGHHWDYYKRLTVRWLCYVCHNELHTWIQEYKKFYLSL